MVTLLRSPPLTPRTKSLPTRVLMVCDMPYMAIITWKELAGHSWGIFGGNTDIA